MHKETEPKGVKCKWGNGDIYKQLKWGAGQNQEQN